MNTAELLAIIEPHKELLRGMDWHVCDALVAGRVCIHRDLPDHRLWETTTPDLAAHIFENVARHALDEWQLTAPDEPPREYRMEPRTDGDTFGIASIGDSHNWEREGNSLAVALALLAWTKTADAGGKK